MALAFTYRDLLERLCDLKALAVPPEDEERGGLFANYNRDCRYDPGTDTYQNWAQKGEGSLYCERVEDGRYVLVDLDGPGVIWRFWTLMNWDDHSRLWIYFDHEETPGVEVSLREFFSRNADDYAATNFPNLVTTECSRGAISYLPIPFRRHIKIVADSEIPHQFTYTTYPEGTVLPDYADRLLRENQIAIAELDRRLEDRGDYDRRLSWQTAVCRVNPGETATLFRAEGKGAIRAIRYYPEDGGSEDAAFYRTSILHIYWDGRARPAVWAPLDGFFGSAMGLHRYRTWVNGMNRWECYSNWYMPYGNGAEIRVENKGEQERVYRFEICVEPLEEDPDGLLRFHAKWHPNEFMDLDMRRFSPGGDRYPDWPLLMTQGRGRFCGMNLHVYNNWRDPDVPATTWWYGKWHPTLDYHVSIDWFWGEGREKFFIDGDPSPACFGTGTEDYIGYAFSAEPPFLRWDKPFAAETDAPLTGKGHTAHSRYQIADNVPFHHGFEAFVEKYKDDLWRDWKNKPEDDGKRNCTYFDVVCYWYQQADTDDAYPAYPLCELWGKYHLPD